jgi:NAD(P)-dependent dehydrogenase (short-subunit alcohol dehydrogenase family)
MDLGLNGKVALVTGAGSQIGFGKGIVMALAKNGCDIISSDIDIEGAEKTAMDVRAIGRRAIATKADITSSLEVKTMVNTVIDEFGRIDILVNNAGAGTAPKSFMETTESDWDRDININLKGVIICTKEVLGRMISRRSGKIINVTSHCAKTGGAAVAVYSAAKAGVIAFTKGLATEMAPLGININSVAPGLGYTQFVSEAPKEMLDSFLERIPTKKATTPEDMGNAVAFLASDASINIVGQSLSVDGGLTMY